MPKRKAYEDVNGEVELPVPLPIQIFLWRQTSPFIRPKVQKLRDATTLEVKEACKSFEKVLVQNIQFGLSPSLTEAIASVTRWRLVQAAFPHVMHCCAALIYNRKDHLNKLGSGEMKLLYTIHWTLLDAAEECADADMERGIVQQSPFYYIFPVTVIEVFIYLFAPLCFLFKDADFQNFRMENGLKVWQALWEYKAPDVPCFTTCVKPKRNLLRGRRSRRLGVTKFGDVFLGAGKVSFEEASTNSSAGGEPSTESCAGTKSEAKSQLHPEDLEEFLAGQTAHEDLHSAVNFTFECQVDSPPHPPKPKESEPDECKVMPASVPTTSGPTYGERWKQAGAAVSKGGRLQGHMAPGGIYEVGGGSGLHRRLVGTKSMSGRVTHPADVTMATFMDVGVLRCLFISQWLEEGVFWSLQYLHRRLEEIYSVSSTEEVPRKRSNSMPAPSVDVSIFQTAEQRRKQMDMEGKENFGNSAANYVTDSPYMNRAQMSQHRPHQRHASERSTLKKMKISDLRAFVDSKLRSKSDKQLESIGSRIDVAGCAPGELDVSSEDQEVSCFVLGSDAKEQRQQFDDIDDDDDDDNDRFPPRPQSALAKLVAQKSEPERVVGADGVSEMVRGKSMPSLRNLFDEREQQSAEIIPVCRLNRQASKSVGEKNGVVASAQTAASSSSSKSQSIPIPNPIITVTEHTPTPSPDHAHKQTPGRFFREYQPTDLTTEESPKLLPRSQTDSNISYQVDDINEAAGTGCYITKDGKLDYLVVLKAIHAVTLHENSCSVRVCEVVLNVVDILLDLGFLTSPEVAVDSDKELDVDSLSLSNAFRRSATSTTTSPDEVSVHHLFMDTLIRVYMHLGCPHGCGEGHRGPPADFLRSQGHSTLGKLHRADKLQFRKFLRQVVTRRCLTDIMDFFHAFVGFCVDPSCSISPLGQKRGKSSETNASVGYATNFGATLCESEYHGVEGLVVTYVFKSLVTRLVDSYRELLSPDNMALYCDVRQLMTYIKEAHGGIFRRVALSGLLDSVDRPHKKKERGTTCVTRVFRHSQSIDPDDPRDSPHSPTVFRAEEHGIERHSGRKSFFRKKTSNVKKTTSSQSIFDESDDYCPSPVQGQSPGSTMMRQHVSLTPRLSISEEEPTSSSGSPTGQRRKLSRFHFVNWMKGGGGGSGGGGASGGGGGGGGSDKSKYELGFEDDGTDSPGLDGGNGFASNRPSRRPSQIHRNGKGFAGTKSASSVSLTLLKARKRVEDHLYKFGIGRNKNKHGSFEEPQEYSRRNSPELEKGPGEPEMVILKERKLVDVRAIQHGMERFSFLLETCQPGSVPDPHLMAALLDLQAPVAARASLMLECAYFVHRCNKGQWPSWMKLNFPMFRPSGPLANRGTPSGLRRTHILQRAAGKMFYRWAEALGKRLEEILAEENLQIADVVAPITDENKKRQLRREDEEEDFLDEGSVNAGGADCPIAMKLIACQLLLEITSFLRETYQYLPKSSRLSHRERPAWDRLPNPNRRWSMGLGSMGFSQTSAQSLVSMPDFGHPGAGYQGERKISFVIHDSGEPESANSSNTTLTMPGEEAASGADDKKGKTAEGDVKGRKIAQGRAHLLRRGGPATAPMSASFKRRSFRLKKLSGRKEKDDEEAGFKRSDSMKSKRKVSAISDRSDTSEHADHDISGEDSPGILSDEQAPDSPLVEGNENDTIPLTTVMPWMKVVVQLVNSFNFICPHQQFCHPNCYRRQMRAAFRISRAVRQVFGDDIEPNFQQKQEQLLREKLRQKDDKRDKKMTRKISSQPGMGSPIKRKESFGRTTQERVEKVSESGSMFGAMRSRPGSSTHLARDAIDIQHMLIKDTSTSKRDRKKEILKREPSPVLRYIKTQVQCLFHCPLSILIKGCVVSSEEIFIDVMPVAWELLLESDQQLVGSAAVVFILSAVKAPEHVTDLLNRELQHEVAGQRINAILRFQALWRCRYQTWPRMEDGAQQMFKVPPPGIDFTLPSPKIGLESCPVIDPPWLPHYKTKVEEVTISQDKTRSFVTATKTRKKQQMEMVQSALRAEDEKKRISRENFLLTSVPITVQAAYEPALYHAVEDHDDVDDDHSDQQRPMMHHVQVATSVFPSCLCTAAIPIIKLLDDATVGPDGVAVYEVAYQAVWTFLVEDPALFLRYFLERLTRERQDEMLQLLRRLLRFFPELPPQAGYALFNYMVGYVMFYVRTPVEGGQDFIGNAMTLLWMIMASIQGVYLKDLKQILRKEQCDTTLLITANVPSAKKVIVHGPDVAGIPSQFPISEDTQFFTILQDSLEFFGIDETQKKEWHLVDHKTNQIHNLNAYVRDFYYFKRSQYPQLSLVRMSPNDAFAALQKQAFKLKFLEIGKVLLTVSVISTSHQVAARVFFLHEELQKLPSFPRKALEADLGYHSGPLGKELLGLDMIHKYVWVKLVAKMFDAMAGTFAYSSDIHLFINVINGALVLHCEDSAVLRLCVSTLINAVLHFKNVFAYNGYFLIMPTLLRIYSNYQNNPLVCQTIEFICKQFYVAHQKPFILQTFGSVAPILDTFVAGTYGEANKVVPQCLFKLLLGLEQPIADPLSIMELVEVEKPLKPLDFCYQMDSETFSVLDAISLCVTVVAYSADSTRGHQMLTILEAVLPFYLKHIQTKKKKVDGFTAARTELQAIHQLAGCIKALINNCEALAKNYTGPQTTTNLRSSSIRNITKSSHSPAFEFDDDSGHTRFLNDLASRKYQERDLEDSQLMQAEFRKPRTALLNVVAEFMSKCYTRYYDLCKKVGQESKASDLVDTRCHMRLADVAHSLLKISPYDQATMMCCGLQRYMNEILPVTDWSQESLRPALMTITRRLDKTFSKICKKAAIRRNTEWEAAAGLLKGIYLTLSKHPYVAHIPHMKTLILICQTIILGDHGAGQGIADTQAPSMSSSAVLNQIPPHHFCSIVVKLVAMQMLVLRDTLSFEQICGGSPILPNAEKTESILLNLILPLCLRVGCGKRDMLAIHRSEITFALNVILNALNPPLHKPMASSAHCNKADTRSSMSFSERSQGRGRQSLFLVAFLGLKILMVCFESQLTTDWPRIARCIRDLCINNQGGVTLWNFLDFVATHRTPLFILMLPHIHNRLTESEHVYEQEYQLREQIKDKLLGRNLGLKCKSVLLMDYTVELRKLQVELTSRRAGELNPRKSVIAECGGEIESSTTVARRSVAATAVSGAVNTEPPQQQTIGGLIASEIARGSRKLVSGVSVSSSSAASPAATKDEGCASGSSDKPPFSRQWSIRSDKVSTLRSILPTEIGRSAVGRFLRRTSYPEGENQNQSAGDVLKSQSPSSSSEPRLARFTRRSTRHLRKRSSRVEGSGGGGGGEIAGAAGGAGSSPSVPSLATPEEGGHSGGGGDRSPSSPLSPSKEGSVGSDGRKHRLQRQMAQSRKTFRFRSMKKQMPMSNEPGHDHVQDILQKSLDEDRPMPGLLEEGQLCPSPGIPQSATAVTSIASISEMEAPVSASASILASVLAAGTVRPVGRLECRRSTFHDVRPRSSSPVRLVKELSVPLQSTDCIDDDDFRASGCPAQLSDSPETASPDEDAALLKDAGDKSASRSSSLLMVFDAKDENTLL